MVLSSLLQLSPELVLLAAALWVLVDDLFSPSPRQTLRTAVTGALLSLGCVLALAWAGPLGPLHPYLQKALVVDRMALFFKALIALMTVLVALLSYRSFTEETTNSGEYYGLLLFVSLGEMLSVSSCELLTFFVSFELLSLPLYVLCGFRRYNSRSAEAGLKYFLTGALSSALLLYGFSWIYGSMGSTVFADWASAPPSEYPQGMMVGLVLVVAGLSFKISAAPFHNWAPDVYEGAPSAVVSYLSCAPKAAMAAVLLRLCWVSLGARVEPFNLSVAWCTMFATLSLISMILGNFTAVPQTSLPRMMAYSGIAHIGYLLLGLASCGAAGAGRLGMAAVMFYAAAYCLSNLGAWAVVVTCQQQGLGQDFRSLSGLSQRSPFLALCLSVFFMSLAGVPPLAGFVGKFYLFRAGFNAHLPVLVFFGVVNSVVSLYYYFKVLRVVYFEEPATPSPFPITFRQRVVLQACLLGVAILGVWPGLATWAVGAAP